MDYADVMQLVGIYLGAFTGIFSLAYGPLALWRWFKAMTAADYKLD